MKKYPKQLLSLILSFAIAFPASSFAQNGDRAHENHQENIDVTMNTFSDPLLTKFMLPLMSTVSIGGVAFFGFVLLGKVNLDIPVDQKLISFSELEILRNPELLENAMRIRLAHNYSLDAFPNLNSIFTNLEKHFTFNFVQNGFFLSATHQKLNQHFDKDVMFKVIQSIQYIDDPKPYLEAQKFLQLVDSIKSFGVNGTRMILENSKPEAFHSANYSKIKNKLLANIGAEIALTVNEVKAAGEGLNLNKIAQPSALQEAMHGLDETIRDARFGKFVGRSMVKGAVIGLIFGGLAYWFFNREIQKPTGIISQNLSINELFELALTDPPAFEGILQEDAELAEKFATVSKKLIQDAKASEQELKDFNQLAEKILQKTQPTKLKTGTM